MSTLSEIIQGMLTPQLFGSLAAKTGVPDTKIRNGLVASTGSIMDGLVARATDTRSMRDVSQILDQTAEVDDTSSLLDEDSGIRRAGARLLGLATNDVPGMIKRLGNSLGLGGGIASTLLATAAAIVMNGLRKFSRLRGGLDANGLSSALLAEAPVHTATPRVVDTTTYRERRPVERTSRNGLWWLLALVPLALLALWFFNRPQHVKQTAGVYIPKIETPDIKTPDVKTTMPDETPPVTALTEPTPPSAPPPAAQPAPEPAPAPTPEPEVTPPEKTALDLPAGSAEATLLSQAQTSDGAANDAWVELDKIKFDTGSAVVPADAHEQIQNVAQILQSHPDVKIEVGGYTSATGSKELNMKLSQERAENVRQALVEQGIDAARVEAKGFADEDKVIDTGKEEQANRRAAARVITSSDAG